MGAAHRVLWRNQLWFRLLGHGYEGGPWDNGHFFYNRSVNNVNVTVIHNVYNTTIVNNTVNRVSLNGGNGGINVRPTSEEEAAASERHLPAVAVQNEHMQAARSNPELRASTNHGKPPIAATPKPGAFNERGAVPASEGGHYNPPSHAENHPANTAVHPNELPPTQRLAAPNTGNSKTDQKYQQQQEKLYALQEQERQKLQQQQEKEHQKLTQQNANDAKKQQVEQKHQQQTQQLAQKHSQQQQQKQVHQQPPQEHTKH